MTGATHPEAADLSSYGDGFGRVALKNQSGDDFRVGGVELFYGRYAPGGMSGEFVAPDFKITDVFVPEPSRPLLAALAALALAARARAGTRVAEAAAARG